MDEVLFSFLLYYCYPSSIAFFQSEKSLFPIDKRIVDKVEELVSEGFIRTSEVETLLNLHVKETFRGKPTPHLSDRRFFPCHKDIYNLIAKYITISFRFFSKSLYFFLFDRFHKGHLASLFDQDEVAALVAEAHLCEFFFRPFHLSSNSGLEF